MANKEDVDRSFYMLPNATPVCALECTQAFQGLTPRERLYAHHLCRASFLGSLITFHQVSPESPGLFVLFRRLFSALPISKLKTMAMESCQFTEDEFQALLIFVAGFVGNSGNYKGFGDSKFIPDVPLEKLEALVKASPGLEGDMARAWNQVSASVTDLHQDRLRLGFGTTTYFSSNATEEDSQRIDRFMKDNGMEGWNTRLFKTIQDGKVHYEIRLASVDTGEVVSAKDLEGCQVRVTRGDYSPILKLVIQELQEALKHSANEEEQRMIEKYMEHFQTGELAAHKDGSRYWIKDTGPAVESYIGFIENYRDPAGVRSEFEGFVAAVNRATSAIFAKLVDNAEMLLERLPWGANYEKDTFLKPDFTSLEVIGFGGSGIPAGINIPNYDEIRQSEGFKNVSLGNVFSSLPSTKINFLTAQDEAMFRSLYKDSFEVQVGLHELLGHGSGKLFQRNRDGSFNFNRDQVKDLLTGEPISSWYEEGETWSTKFTNLASAYEECRAEAVGYVLCCYPDVLKIFGFEGQKADDVKYCNWMAEIRAGLMGLELFDPKTRRWGQSHSYARYVLLRVVMEAGENFVSIKDKTGEDGQPDLLFSLDPTKIDSVGKPAVEEFLKKLQLFKSTGDLAKGKALFESYGEVDELALHWRSVVVARRQPRRIFVQPNTFLTDSREDVDLKTYPETAEGLVESLVERFPDSAVDKDMLDLAEKDRHHFN